MLWDEEVIATQCIAVSEVGIKNAKDQDEKRRGEHGFTWSDFVKNLPSKLTFLYHKNLHSFLHPMLRYREEV